MPPMGLSFQELGSLDKTPSKLYPEPPTVPRMERPDDKEIRYASYQLMYLQEQKTSPYWPTLEQRKQGDLPRFSDRYRPEAQDLPSLKSIHLQKEVFPKGLWDSFMEGETKREEQKGKHSPATWAIALCIVPNLLNRSANDMLVRFLSDSFHTRQPRRRRAARSTGTRSISKTARPKTTWATPRPSPRTSATTKTRSTTTTPKTTLTTAKTTTLAMTKVENRPTTKWLFPLLRQSARSLRQLPGL